MYYRSLLLALIIVAFLLCGVACLRQTSDPIPIATPVSPPSPIVPLEVTPVDLWTDVVVEADCIVSGTITDEQYEVVTVGGKGAYTIFTLSVEKVIKGNPDTKEVSIKVEGGPIDELYQVPTGAYFAISDRVLVLLHLEEGNVYTRPGILWYEGSTGMSRASLSYCIGRIINIMIENNIPIALPASEWPPLPLQLPVLRPKNGESISPEIGESIGFNKDSFIYVCNYRNGNIYIYNLATFKLISQIFVGEEAMIVPSPSNPKLCAISRATHNLSFINMKTNSLEKQIVLPEAPGDVTYISDLDDICVTLPAFKQIQILKAPLFNVEKTYTLEEFPDRIATSQDGKMVYITTGSKLNEGTEHLLALDLGTGIKTAEIDLVKDWHDFAIPKQGNQVYVTNLGSCTISKINMRSFEIEDTFTNITKRQFPNATINQIVISPDNNYLFFNDGQADYIRAINLKTGAIDKEISVENGSWGIYVSRSGHYLLSVAAGGIEIETGGKMPGSVTIIDIALWKVVCRMWIDNGAIEVVGNKAF